MAWVLEHWWILLLFAIYAALMVHHAWTGSRRTKGMVDYYVGGRAMGGVAVGLSFFATFSSTNSFVGYAGQSYIYGLPWLLLAPFLVFFSLVSWLVVAPRLRLFTEQLDSVTLPDFLGFRFQSSAVRFAAAIIVILASIFYMTAIFKGAGTLLEAFLGLPYWIAILIFLVVVMIYTAVGGYISVVRTDVIQGVLMIFGTMLLFGGTVSAAGGPASFFRVSEIPEAAHLFSWNAAMPLTVLLGLHFAGSIKFVVEPRQLSRFYSLKDRRALRTGMWVSTLALAFVYSLLVPIGIYARNIFPSGFTDSDRIVPALLTDPAIFSAEVSGFLLLVMVAAAMSSLDSVLLVTASTCQRDVVSVLRRSPLPDTQAVAHTRFYVVLFAVLTTLVAVDPPGGIVTLTVFSGSLYAACFLPALLLGLYWRSGNGKAALASFFTGILCLLLWPVMNPWPNVHEVFPSILLSLTVFIALSLATPPADSRQVDRLFAPPSMPGSVEPA